MAVFTCCENLCARKRHLTFLRIGVWLERQTFVHSQLKERLGLQEVEASRISGQSAHEGGKAVSPRLRSSLSPRRYPWYSFLLRGCVDDEEGRTSSAYF